MARRLAITTQVAAAVLGGALLAGLAVHLTSSDAQPVKHLVLDEARAERAGECIVLQIAFTVPVQYLRHSPPDRGASLTIQVQPVTLGPAQAEGIRGREAVRVLGDGPLPVSAVVYDGTADGPAWIVVDFDEPFRFELEQGADLRGLTVRAAPLGLDGPCRSGD